MRSSTASHAPCINEPSLRLLRQSGHKKADNSVTDCLSVGSEADRGNAERAALASFEENDVGNLSPNCIAEIPGTVKIIMKRVKLRGNNL